MSIPITMYMTNDGNKTFGIQADADLYDTIDEKATEFMKELNLPEKTFSNDEGYLQHPKGTYQRIERRLKTLYNLWSPSSDVHTTNVHILRLLEDSQIDCLNELANRLYCIDEDTDREYGQPYFLINKDKVRDEQLN